MIDLHVHILPGLDDGAKNLKESLNMCQVAVNDGITTVVATPHTGNGSYENNHTRILWAVKELASNVQKEGIQLSILPGADVYVHEQLATLIKAREVMTVNDTMRYVMVEFPRHITPPNYLEWMFHLTIAGITPILTHPERNTAIHQKIDIVRQWVEKGGLVQVTAMSLTGGFGKEVRKCSEELLKHRLVQVIASDAHSPKRSPPVLSFAVEYAASLVGSEYARKLVGDYPAAIVAGKPVNIPEPIPEKRTFFSRLAHRP